MAETLDDDDIAWFKEEMGLSRGPVSNLRGAKEIVQELKPNDVNVRHRRGLVNQLRPAVTLMGAGASMSVARIKASLVCHSKKRPPKRSGGPSRGR
jgi:hypothetical protein